MIYTSVVKSKNSRHRSLGAYLKAEGVSQRAFAKRVGVVPSYVSMITRGEREPCLSVALKMAAAANIPIGSLAIPERTREAVTS